MGALRIAAAAGMLVGLLILAGGLVVQRSRADEPIRVPTRAEVTGAVGVIIDIEPGSDANVINQPCGGDIAVAVLSTAEFDAATADSTTATFAQAPPADSAIEDVDGDGAPDLMLHFKCQEVSILPDATQACLQGRTNEGASIEGCDSVTIAAGAGLEEDAAVLPATPVAAAAVLAPTSIGDDESAGGWPWLYLLLGGGVALTALVGLGSFLKLRWR